MVVDVTFESCHIVAKDMVKEDRKTAQGLCRELTVQLGVRDDDVSPAIVGSEVVEVQDSTHKSNQK